MHILIIPSWYKDKEHPYSGIFFREQAVALAKIGHQVSVLFVEPRSLSTFKLYKIKENHGQISDVLDANVREYILKVWNPLMPTLCGKRIFAKLHQYLFKKYIAKHGRPDIIHAHSVFMAGVVAKNIYQKYDIPYIVTEHSSTFFNLKQVLKQSLFQDMKESNEKASRYFAVGKKLADNLETTYGLQNVQVFPNFVDTSFFMNKANHRVMAEASVENFVFLSIGNLIPTKGHCELIKAFSLVFKGNLQVKLRIIGAGELKNTLTQIISEEGLSEQVFLVGTLDKSQIKREFELASAFVLASKIETFGVVFIEAMAAGLPVIATLSGGPEDFVTPITGYLIPKESEVDLVRALQNMYENRADFDSEKIQKYVWDKFDSEVLAKRLTIMYESVKQDKNK